VAISIGPKGHVDVVASGGGGPQRKVRLAQFYGRSDTGFIAQPIMRLGEAPIAIVDVDKGRLVTSSFGGVVTGGLSQTDTGGLGDDGSMSGHVMLAIITDTGAAGL